MAKTWILDTETKGTGAHIAPLRKRAEGGERRELNRVQLGGPAPKDALPLEEPEPRRFKVIDVVTRQTLAEDVDARETVEVLGDVHAIVDVSIYVWEPERDKWRLLTLDEQRALWSFRERDDARNGKSKSKSRTRRGGKRR